MSKRGKLKIKGKKLPVRTLKRELTKFFATKKKSRYTIKQVIAKMRIANSHSSVKHAVDLLIEDGILFSKDDRYQWDMNATVSQQSKYFPAKEYIGKVDLTRSGDGYIVVDDLEDDVFVPRKFLKGAVNKDLVKIKVPKLPGKRRPEGKVIEIVERAVTHVMGKIRLGDKYATLYPVKRDIADEVYIKNDDLKDVLDGDYAVVKITEWGQSQNKGIWGVVTSKVEKASPIDIAMQSIFLSHGFDLEFPPEVMNEVKNIELDINEEEVSKRRDFRDILTITIDPATAKDFDDALSYQVLEDGNIEVGIHIADVTHYLRPGTALDKEAFHRSTSVYLVDRVLPMLPEKLSNNLCSLNPHEDRYTFSAVFTFDEKYKIVNEWFGRAVIHSDRRFTYEEAQEVIETGEGDHALELRKLNEIAHKLRKLKYKNGAISFDSEEVQFQLDESGKPVDMYVKERKDAHLLVEDFMLLANKSVAKYVAKKAENEVPNIYRVHDLPNEEKLQDFALFAKELGFTMNLKTPRQVADSFNRLMKEAEHNEALQLLTPLAIRTMSKAVYTTENIGHYGLGFEHYTHFTSPIRRYADVLVHRILFDNLDKTHRVDKADLEVKAKYISTKEKSAAEAERESVKYMQVLYISERIGQQFEGVVSGMIDKGFFVALEKSRAEGLIEFDTLIERYDMGDSKFRATAPSGHTISMGDRVIVEVTEVDIDKRQIEMKVIEFFNQKEEE